MIEVDNRTNYNIDLSKLNLVTKELNITQDIELLLVDNSEIKELNLTHRGVDKATDVLSFPISKAKHLPLGSIVISVDYAKDVSTKLSHSLEDEVALLFIHGLLHIMGYDHETDNGEMRKKEKELINALSLPKSLIIRTEGEKVC